MIAIDFLAELPEQVVYLLYQVDRRREVSIAEALEAAGLPLAIWRMLLALQPIQPCTINAFARRIVIQWNRKALGEMALERLETFRETHNEFLRSTIPDQASAGTIGNFSHRSTTNRR